MSLREHVKQLLRMCGHALVSTVHDRLNTMDQQVDALVRQNTSLARTDTALLEAGIHIIETLKQMERELRIQGDAMRGGLERLARQARADVQGHSARDAELREALRQQNEQLQRLVSQLLEQQQAAPPDGWLREAIASLERSTSEILNRDLVRQVCVETPDYGLANPETGLMSFLYSYLPSRTAIDIGAHRGDVSERLLRAGYEVYAFEPFPPAFESLVERLGANGSFHGHNVAVGAVEGETTLYLAEDLSGSGRFGDPSVFNTLKRHSMPADVQFTGAMTVKVRTLACLHESQIVPADAGLLKIDTEGFDLEVIRGMGHHRYPVVAAEFWDTNIPFALDEQSYTLQCLVQQMKSIGYCWHIVVYRIWGKNHTAYYCNYDRSIPSSWGNVFFFLEHDLFSRGHEWCSAALPRTYFRPAAVR